MTTAVMDRPSPPVRQSRDRSHRQSTYIPTTQENDDTPQRSAGGQADRSKSTTRTGTNASRSFFRRDEMSGRHLDRDEGIPSSSPEMSRRKRLGMSQAVIPSIPGYGEGSRGNGPPSSKASNPERYETSNSSNPVDALSQWRLGRARRRSSAAGSSRPKSMAIASNQDFGPPPSSSQQALRVQTQPSLLRPSTSQKSHSSAVSHALAKLNGTTAKPPDARKLLLLMNTTKGAMSGKCIVQQTRSSQWVPGLCTIKAHGSLEWTPISVSSRGERALIKNLRGCRVQALLNPEGGTPQILVQGQGTNDQGIRFIPETQAKFEAWFSALLCWHSCQNSENPQGRSGIRRLVALPFPAGPIRKVNERPSSAKERKEKDPIIKVGKLLYLDQDNIDRDTTPVSGRSSSPAPEIMPPWRRVSCIIRESGELLLYTTASLQTLATIRLSKLTKSAVQRLHPSLFGMEHCIALYPQYSDATDVCSRVRPIVLSFETRVLFESWFVLLRAFTLPEIYGSKQLVDTLNDQPSPQTPVEDFDFSSIAFLPIQSDVQPGLFRMERTLQVQIGEARFPKATPDESGRLLPDARYDTTKGVAYVRIFLDGQVKAKTTAKADKQHPFWYESFELIDLGPVSSSVTFQLKLREIDTSSPIYKTQSPRSKQPQPSSYMTDHHDRTLGEVNIDLNELEPHKEVDKYWPIQNRSGQTIGEMSLKIRLGKEIILMDSDYMSLDRLLCNFSNAITFQIAEKVPNELSRLSEVLLNIYQASNNAEEWLNSLSEEEIDGIRKEAPLGRLRLDAEDSRESQVREENKSALAEANLLFRGNTLLSKALDLHMKRLGKEYLEETIGARIRSIAGADADCEVDPVRLVEGASLQQNWNRLNAAIHSIWKAIAESANRCPPELRQVFRHIRACAEDRYGDRMRSVSYTSVSGFLFLRFFCPAVLNPRLFGLLKDNPTPRVQRTFTLLAKSLQGLANQSLFGTKERWMEHMNLSFLSPCRQQFKEFVDTICAVPAEGVENQQPASYSAPRAIFSRLPPSSKEGFPRTPYLIDHCRNLSALVNLWMESYRGAHSGFINAPIHDTDLRQFHTLCTELKLKAQASLANADHVEKGINTVSERWITIAERVEQFPEDFYLYTDSSEPTSGSTNDHSSPNYAYPLTPDLTRSPMHSPDTEDNLTFDEDSNTLPLRDRPRGRSNISNFSSPYLNSTSDKMRSQTSIVSADAVSHHSAPFNHNSHSASATNSPANLSRAPSRTASSLNMPSSASVASLSDVEGNDGRESHRKTMTPRSRYDEGVRTSSRDLLEQGKVPPQKTQERSTSRFTLFGRKKK